MRIIGGALGGRRLRAPAGLSTRPTADRVREALFNILGPPKRDARVLDLYAGSGALGLEALSRGAARAVLVDSDPAALAVLRRNVAELGLSEQVEVLGLPVLRALSRLSPPFHWIFADPPYGSGDLPSLLGLLGDAALLKEEGTVIVEHARKGGPAHVPGEAHGRLHRYDQRCYGQSALSFYALSSSPEEPAGPDAGQVTR